MPALMVKKGREITANRVKGLGTEPKYVAWGTSDANLNDNNTALDAEAPESRAEGVSSIVNDTYYQVVGTLTATATRAIKEAGLFDAATGGNLYIRGTFGVINLDADDSVQFTIQGRYVAP